MKRFFWDNSRGDLESELGGSEFPARGMRRTGRCRSRKLIALAAGAFLLGAANEDAPGWTAGRASAGLRWMGRLSYELYLFHIIVLGLMRNVVERAQLGYHARLPWLRCSCC